MSERLNKVKNHIANNKKIYIVVGITAAVSVTTTVILMKQHSVNVVHAELVQNMNQVALGWGNNQTIINLVERSTPSTPVHLVGTNKYFASMSEAARETGHSVANISKNVHGLRPDVNGDVFTMLDKVN